MTRRVIDREIPGIPEALRQAGATAGIPSAILSRGLAGVASRTLIVNLPGSSGGVRDGMAVLRQVLVHAVDQIRGGDHPRAEQSGAHENGGAREHEQEAAGRQDTPSDVSEDQHLGHHENLDPTAAPADSAGHSAEIA
jgi:hypothetical protein